MTSTALPAALANLPPGPVQLVVFDIDGVPRGKWLARDKLLQGLNGGLGFCNVVFGWDIADRPYDNTTLVGWHTGYPDARVQVYPNTLRRVPWQQQIPLLIADFGGGSLADLCPRTLLRRVLAKAADMNLDVLAAIEYEWFNFRETPGSLAAKQGAAPTPITPGMHGYSLLRPAAEDAYFRALWEGMENFGVPLEGLHTETGPGVYEAAPRYTSALEAADRAALFKLGTKQIALDHGFIASFMAKWRSDLPGCGGHVHQSLRRLSDDAPLGFDESRPHGLSRTFEHYLAGQLYALPTLLALFAPTVNSYRRLVPGSWAATSVTWGLDNRTAALRLVGDTPTSFRLEHRVPGADANPYLVLAAMVAAGLYGIEHELPLDHPPIQGNAYDGATLPPLARDLSDATAQLRQGAAFAKTLFNDAFVEHFIATREWEWRQYQTNVKDLSETEISAWERERYLELV